MANRIKDKILLFDLEVVDLLLNYWPDSCDIIDDVWNPADDVGSEARVQTLYTGIVYMDILVTCTYDLDKFQSEWLKTHVTIMKFECERHYWVCDLKKQNS